jgi:membrane protease YdiL (CAAX protease family)
VNLEGIDRDAPDHPRLPWGTVVLRVAVFLAFGALGALLSGLLPVEGTLRRSVLFTFSAGVLANAIPVRLFERARLADFGLGWTWGSGRDFLKGLGYGAGAAAAVLAAMLLFDWVQFEKAPADTVGAAAVTSVLLFIGATGEEMMFHGYAFQLLVRHVGAFATILPVGLAFGLAHMGNQNSTLLAVLNTVVWGALLGYACYRSGALWMPIGMHFGWNLILPLAGANLSGFTMRVTGYALHQNAGGMLSGGAYGPEGSVLTTVAAGVLFWVVTRAVDVDAVDPMDVDKEAQ